MAEEKFKNYLLGILGIGLIIVAVILAYKPAQNQLDQRDTISISGNAEKEVAPDEAEIYISVQTEGKTSSDAQKGNSENTNKVIAALKAMGVFDDKIETTQYSISPKYNYDKQTGESFVYGYIVTNTVKVTTEDIANTGKYVDAAVSAGANNLQGINFKLKTETQKRIKDELLSLAAQDAKNRAQLTVSGLNVGLGKIVSVSVNDVYFPTYRSDFAGSMISAKAEAAPAPTDIIPTKEKVSASIYIVYELE
jgi:uncharacterized protein